MLKTLFILRSGMMRYKRMKQFSDSTHAMTSQRRRFLSLGLALMLVAGSATHADGRDDHERARQAVKAGEVLPLRSVLERVERDYPGQVMEVELEREHGMWIYEIKILRDNGALLKLEIDARDGRVFGSKERGEGKR